VGAGTLQNGQSGVVMEFVVLAKPDGSDRTLVSAEQRSAAADSGFSVVEFLVDAPTRGAARRAWDAHRHGEDTPSTEPSDDDYGLESLSDVERAAMVGLVGALVERDRKQLEAAGAYDPPGADPYLWTQPYGRWDRVDLVMPPGDPRHWSGEVIRADDDRRWVGVVVDMWTAQEGPSDLSLEADLVKDDGSVRARFSNLHVM